MNLLVYNRHNANTDLSYEALALRLGLLLADFTFAIGKSSFYIFYQENMMKLAEAGRIKTLLNPLHQRTDTDAIKEAVADLKYLRNKKNKSRADIVFLKVTEKFVNKTFEAHIQDIAKKYDITGLPQLAPLETDRSNGLRIIYIDTEKGELLPAFRLSDILLCKLNESSIQAVDVLLLSGPVTKVIHDHVAMTQLCDLPNLNSLQSDQLLSARQRLASFRKELNDLIPLMLPAEGGTPFSTGTWNLDGLKPFSVRLQQGLHNVPEVEWSANMDNELCLVAKVGCMDTPALWQLLRQNDLLPDDTWEVLSGAIASGNHSAQTPIMTVSHTNDTPLPDYFSEEESLQHKRKTLDLNQR